MTLTTLQSEHRYRPRGACRAVLSARDSEVLVSGPAGTGKSRACLEKLHLLALMNPGMRGLICRKTATSLSSTALVTWRRFVVHESLLAGDVEFYGGSAQEPPQYRYKNGSIIVIGGLDKITRIMSAEYDIVYVQEATELTENDWESLTSRLRNWVISFQQMMADCNPSYPTHWLKQRCDQGKCRLLNSRHEDNPMLFRSDGTITERGADYINKLDRLSGVRHQRLRLGRWVAAEGVIFEEFGSQHFLSELPPFTGEPTDPNGIPLSWDRFWSVDFGYVNPFVLQCWTEDPDGRLIMYREIYQTKTLVEDHAKHILKIVAPEGKWLEPQPSVIVCDHDAEGRATLENHLGMSTSPAHKSVLEGIEAVQARMRDAGDGHPRVFFMRNAVVEIDPELVDGGRPTCTVEEIPGYVWADKKTKEEPIKADDHGCDALRYIVAEREFGVRVIYRSFEA
jgi:phage terminase large subunit